MKFLIDGKVRWIEHNPPYSYSDDGGYLVTSWLSAGRHRFTVQAKSSSGAKATETVVARIVAARDPPTELAGSWSRTIGTPVPPDPAYPGDAVPAGTWTFVFDRRLVRERRFSDAHACANRQVQPAKWRLRRDLDAGSLRRKR